MNHHFSSNYQQRTPLGAPGSCLAFFRETARRFAALRVTPQDARILLLKHTLYLIGSVKIPYRPDFGSLIYGGFKRKVSPGKLHTFAHG